MKTLAVHSAARAVLLAASAPPEAQEAAAEALLAALGCPDGNLTTVDPIADLIEIDFTGEGRFVMSMVVPEEV